MRLSTTISFEYEIPAPLNKTEADILNNEEVLMSDPRAAMIAIETLRRGPVNVIEVRRASAPLNREDS